MRISAESESGSSSRFSLSFGQWQRLRGFILSGLYMGRGRRGAEYGPVEVERSPRTSVEFPEVDTVDVGCACFWFGGRVAGDGGGEGEDEEG